jgi:FkbM family methyltransferase
MTPRSILTPIAAGCFKLSFGNQDLYFTDEPDSRALEYISNDLLCDNYGLLTIPFSSGDIVLDVGSHVGTMAIFLALRHPDIRIFACEPHPKNFRHLVANVARNAAFNVQPLNLAVSPNGHRIDLYYCAANSGATSIFPRTSHLPFAERVQSDTLQGIVAAQGIERCRLLKLDCEGMEYEILKSLGALDCFDFLSVEIHYGPTIAKTRNDADELNNYLRDRLTDNRLHSFYCQLD